MKDMKSLTGFFFIVLLCFSFAGLAQEPKSTLLYGAKVYPDMPGFLSYPFRTSLTLDKNVHAFVSPEDGDVFVLLYKGQKVKVLYPTASLKGEWFYFVEIFDGTRLYVPVRELY